MDLGWIAFGALVLLDFLVIAAWKPYLAAYMGEKGKRLATQEDIEKVLAEVRVITKETERIKAEVSDDFWHRQTVWNERRSAYVEVLTALRSYGEWTQASLIEMRDQGTPLRRFSIEDFTKLLDRLNHARTVAGLFAGPDVELILNKLLDDLRTSKGDQIETYEAWSKAVIAARTPLFNAFKKELMERRD